MRGGKTCSNGQVSEAALEAGGRKPVAGQAASKL